MFQADTDSRSNFPTERSFHAFKKQRFVFTDSVLMTKRMSLWAAALAEA